MIFIQAYKKAVSAAVILILLSVGIIEGTYFKSKVYAASYSNNFDPDIFGTWGSVCGPNGSITKSSDPDGYTGSAIKFTYSSTTSSATWGSRAYVESPANWSYSDMVSIDMMFKGGAAGTPFTIGFQENDGEKWYSPKVILNGDTTWKKLSFSVEQLTIYPYGTIADSKFTGDVKYIIIGIPYMTGVNLSGEFSIDDFTINDGTSVSPTPNSNFIITFDENVDILTKWSTNADDANGAYITRETVNNGYVGKALKFSYSVPNTANKMWGSRAWGIFPEGLNLSSINSIDLMIKGGSTGTPFMVGVTEVDGDRWFSYDQILDGSTLWKKLSVPWNQIYLFQKLGDGIFTGDLKSFTIGIPFKSNKSSSGELYIDNVVLNTGGDNFPPLSEEDIEELSSASLNSITLNDANLRIIPEFSPDITDYVMEVPYNTSTEFIKSLVNYTTKSGKANADVIYPDTIPGSITISVTSYDKTNTKSYIIKLIKGDPIQISNLAYTGLDGKGTLINKLVTVSATVSNLSTENLNATLLAGIYNNDTNELMDIDCYYSSIAAGTSITYNIALNFPSDINLTPGKYIIKTFAWQSLYNQKAIMDNFKSDQ